MSLLIRYFSSVFLIFFATAIFFISLPGRCAALSNVTQSIGGKQGGRRFHVLRRCIYPVIVGMKFLKATKLFTENKHMLVERPSWYLSQLPRLGYITSGQWCPINCDADGQHLIGCADTGSDLDLMSLDFANEKGFIIDRRESVCRRVQLADGRIVETIGCVRVSKQIYQWAPT